MKKITVVLIGLCAMFFSFQLSGEISSEKPLNKKMHLPKQDEIALGDALVNLKEGLVKQGSFEASAQKKGGTMNLQEVFFAAPIIYSILLAMSIIALVILIYTLLTFRKRDLMTKATLDELRSFLSTENYQQALQYCETNQTLLSAMIASGICTRNRGTQFMIESIKTEGKRATEKIWQRISILNDIVIIAPMFGLLGTVIGMFYAFYDINRSIDTLSALFDGLGVAVGTTVAGLIVAILSMLFYSILKFKMVKQLAIIENEALSLGNLIRTKD